MKYIIKVWIPVEDAELEEYDSQEDALQDLASMELMQPENRYELEEVDDNG